MGFLFQTTNIWNQEKHIRARYFCEVHNCNFNCHLGKQVKGLAFLESAIYRLTGVRTMFVLPVRVLFCTDIPL